MKSALLWQSKDGVPTSQPNALSTYDSEGGLSTPVARSFDATNKEVMLPQGDDQLISHALVSVVGTLLWKPEPHLNTGFFQETPQG